MSPIFHLLPHLIYSSFNDISSLYHKPNIWCHCTN